MENISYTLKRSRRARWLKIIVENTGTVVVVAPYRMDVATIEKFVRQKSPWIWHKIHHFTKNTIIIPAQSFVDAKEQAREHIESRVAFINERYNFKFNKISIKDHKRKWGSCSVRGNLNFNYRIMFLPIDLMDYIIVHELCHLAELNHSKNFWRLVAREVPDYSHKRRQLKLISFSL